MKCGYSPLVLGQIALVLQFLVVTSRHTNHHRTDMDLCFRCPAGFGVVHRCTEIQDTECAPCEQDYYSSHKSSHRPCYPCSRCGVGLYVAHKCTAVTDTVCDSCHTFQGPHNEDFYDKCVRPLLATPSSTERTTTEADSLSTYWAKMDPDLRWSEIFGMSALIITVTLAGIVGYFCKGDATKKDDSDCSYEAVATYDIVAL